MEYEDDLLYENYNTRLELDRNRIASELHDSSLQNLTHIIHQIELASLYMDVDVDKAKLELNDVLKQLRLINKEIRNTIFDLRPMSFDDLGFTETIRQYTEFIQHRYNNKVVVDEMIDLSLYFSKEKLLEIYRIIQECLTNAAKHAKATIIVLSIIKNDNYIKIIVCDDGIGLTKDNLKKQDHYGLMILQERVRHLHGEFYMNHVSREPLVYIRPEQIGLCIEIKIAIDIN